MGKRRDIKEIGRAIFVPIPTGLLQRILQFCTAFQLAIKQLKIIGFPIGFKGTQGFLDNMRDLLRGDF